MTDPFSITSSAAGVISLGLTVAHELLDYYESYKSSGSTIIAMYSQMESLASTLTLLNKVIDRGYNQLDPEIARTVEGSIESCRESTEKLEKKLVKIRNASQSEPGGGLRQQLGKQVHKAMFPFKESTLVKLREIAMEFRNDLGLVLEILQIDVSAVSLQRLDDIDGKLDLVIEDSAAASANILKFGQDIEAIGDILSGSQLDEERRQIHEWLRPPDPYANQDAARQKHEKSTNDWLLRSKDFAKWMDTSSNLLTIYGIPGSGKTILASSVIAELEEKTLNSKSVLLYYYFDFNDCQKQNVSGCISSLLLQLAFVMDDFQKLWLLYMACDLGRRQPRVNEMEKMLRSALEALPRVYMVLDALDECQELDELLSFIVTACTSWDIDVKFLVTSRKERNVDEALQNLDPIAIDLRDELITQDIQVYVKRRLDTSSRLKKWCSDPRIKSEIEHTLISGADGMFRWVVCQLDALQKCLTATSLKKTLRALPKTLYATYDRILSEIDSFYREQAFQILQWLVVAQRPLFIEEATEAITIVPDAGNGPPVFDTDNRLSDPSDVFQICLSLVSTSVTADSRTRDGQLVPAEYIKVAHYSVKEYLTSEAVLQGPCSRFSINENDAHVSVAKACIAYLLNMEGCVSGSTHVEFPLASYAAKYWNVHAKLGSQSNGVPILENMIIKLLGSTHAMSNVYFLCKPHYPVQAYIEKPSLHWAVQYDLSDIVIKISTSISDINIRDSFGRTALHIAIQFRRDGIARSLLERGIDKNALDAIGTALHYAVHTEDVSVVQMLLEAGADPNLRTGLRFTPLYYAADRNNLKMVQLLLSHGADPNAPCKLIGVKHMENQRESQHGRKTSTVEQSSTGTPLQVAAWRGYSGIVTALLNSGAMIQDSEMSLLAQGKVREARQALEMTGAYVYYLPFQTHLPDYQDVVRALQNHAGASSIAA